MTGPDGQADFVPASFEDLRRDTRPNRSKLEPTDEGRSRDLTDLAAEGDFMRNSGRLAAGAAAIGMLLVLYAYGRPLLATFDAFHTAGQVAADKAGHQLQGVQGAVSGLAGQASAIKATDQRAIGTAKGGLDCLTGRAACPNGTSPFR